MRIRRTLPPVGYRIPLSDIVRAAAPGFGRAGRHALEQQAGRHFGLRHAFAVSSGKAALVAILRALHALTGRTKVVLPAYTCYSLPSAIVKAGLVPVPSDINRDSFDYDYEQLPALLASDVLCALSVHLFGIPSDTARLQRLCQKKGILVVEDAAQAMGVVCNGSLLGTRSDVGFFSLGRGKNLTCGSGGLVVANRPEIAEAISRVVGSFGVSRATEDVRTLVGLVALSVLISPRLYWLPAGIPSLKLGETIFHDDFPLERMSDFQARVLGDWPEHLAALNAGRREIGELYVRQIVGAAAYGEGVPYLRFPLVIEEGTVRDRILREGRPLGIGRMYPGSVGGIPQIRAMLSRHAFPEAERMAASLLTLPTHPLLTETDCFRIAELVNAATAEVPRPLAPDRGISPESADHHPRPACGR